MRWQNTTLIATLVISDNEWCGNENNDLVNIRVKRETGYIVLPEVEFPGFRGKQKTQSQVKVKYLNLFRRNVRV